MSKNSKIIGWVLTALLSALLLFSVIGKFALPEMAEMLTSRGLGDWYIIIGIGELIATILFILPRTNIFGTLLLSAHMGGAILLHMMNAEPFILQSVVLVLIWITAFIRNPKMLEIIKNKK